LLKFFKNQINLVDSTFRFSNLSYVQYQTTKNTKLNYFRWIRLAFKIRDEAPSRGRIFSKNDNVHFIYSKNSIISTTKFHKLFYPKHLAKSFKNFSGVPEQESIENRASILSLLTRPTVTAKLYRCNWQNDDLGTLV